MNSPVSLTRKDTLKAALGLDTAKRPAFLAPLAGYSDLPFRQLCHREGALLVTTELVSAAGVRHSGIQKSWRYLAIDPAREGKALIQLFGQDVDDFLYAAEAILDHPVLGQCWGIDINMGCPVPKVVKSGAGSALLKTPALAEAITRRLAELVHPAGYRLGCKIRRGFASGEENAPELAVRLTAAGCDVLTIHGRYREQFYSGAADWGVIARSRAALAAAGYGDEVLLVANGDVKDAATAEACLLATGADAVAVGRAAEGNPWVFRELAGRPDAPDEAERAAVIWEHACLLADFLGEDPAMREFRKTLAAYSQGRPHARQLRNLGSQIASLEDVEAWLQAYLRTD